MSGRRKKIDEDLRLFIERTVVPTLVEKLVAELLKRDVNIRSRQAPAKYLSARQAAAHVGHTYRSFDQFVRRYGVPFKRYGRQRLFEPAVLDRVFQTMALRPQTRKRGK